LVVGLQNEISGAFASVSGEVLNKESTKNWGYRGLPGSIWESDRYHSGWRKVTMKFKVPLIVCPEGGQAETIQEIAIVEKDCQRIEQIRQSLAEAKALLQAVPQSMVERQIAAFLVTRTHC
jgi:hypothetical protein